MLHKFFNMKINCPKPQWPDPHNCVVNLQNKATFSYFVSFNCVVQDLKDIYDLIFTIGQVKLQIIH